MTLYITLQYSFTLELVKKIEIFLKKVEFWGIFEKSVKIIKFYLFYIWIYITCIDGLL